MCHCCCRNFIARDGSSRSEGKRSSKHLLSLYTCLHLQLDELNRVYMITLAGAKILLVLFSVFCTYGAIRLNGIMAISLGWIGSSCTIFLAITLNTLAEFNVQSMSALQVFRKQMAAGSSNDGETPSKWFRMKVNSLREFRVQIGSAYYIDKPIILTTFKIIFDATINFLLMNK